METFELKHKICFDKSFASSPLVIHWNHQKNESLNLFPRNLTISSGVKCWFICNICGHDFDSSLHNVTTGYWCGFCTNMRLCENENCDRCFNRSFASSPKAIYWCKKNILPPRKCFKSSNKKCFFNCSECNHEIFLSLSQVTRGNWCIYCAHQKLCEDLDCKKCLEKSFASHVKSYLWSTKNCLTPRQIFKNTFQKMFLFNCDICDHEFETTTEKISEEHNKCSFCANKTLCDNDKCVLCHNKSFASHPKSLFWNIDNEISPRKVFKNSHSIFKFNCVECAHSFNIVLYTLSQNNWCCYCGNKRLCENIDCKVCFDKSFASHPKSKNWSIINKKSPNEVFKSTHSKYWFNCDSCKSHFDTSLSNVSSGQWCRFCKTKTETKLFEWLAKIFPSTIRQFKKEWCKNIRCLPFDFAIQEINTIIELDGLQHFQQVSNWPSPDSIQKTDVFKMKCALENGFSVIRLKQDDVWNDKINWQEKIEMAINEAIKEKKASIYYICENNDYAHFLNSNA